MKKNSSLLILIVLFFFSMGMIRFFYTKITKIIIKKEKNIVVNNSDELLGEFIESGEEVKKYKARKINFNEDASQFYPNIHPIQAEFQVSQSFSKSHPGIDYVAKKNTVIVSTANGYVEKIINDKYYGTAIIINHLNGLTTLYAHLSQTLINENQFVFKNDQVGVIGNTGYSSSIHLHYAISKDNEFINPLNCIGRKNEKKQKV